MKKLVQIMIICFLSFLFITSTNAQPTTIPLGLPGFGPVGIGTITPLTFSPTCLLSIEGGDLNIGNPTFPNKGYRIFDNITSASNYVLWHNGNSQNIFVGVGAGGAGGAGNFSTFVGSSAGAASTAFASENTFVGFSAGLVNTSGTYNTFIGSRAGFNNLANSNTFVGTNSGWTNVLGMDNTFLGINTGFTNNEGSSNVFVGENSGFSNVQGNYNTFTGTSSGNLNNNGTFNVYSGYFAGYKNKDGNNNTFSGSFAGENNINDNNVFIGFAAGKVNVRGITNTCLGYQADLLYPGLKDASAIGTNAIVTTSETMILGDNIPVGAGLSGNTIGPGQQPTSGNTMLEIKSPAGNNPGTPDPNDLGGCATGLSGLQFRDLNSGSTPWCANPGSGVLSVDKYGNVIMVPDGGGGAGGGICGSSPIGLPSGGWEIPLNNQNYVFTNNGAITGGAVGIGNITGCSPSAVLDVENDPTISGLLTAGLFNNTGTTSTGNTFTLNGNDDLTGSSWNSGGVFEASNASSINSGAVGISNTATGSINAGIWGMADGGSSANVGVAGWADGSAGPVNYGGFFTASGNVTNPLGINYGVYSQVQSSMASPTGAPQNFGVFSIVNDGTNVMGWQAGSGYPQGTDIAIYGNCTSSAVYHPGPSAATSYWAPGKGWAGYFDGDVNVNGLCFNTNTAWTVSDQQFKTHIDSIQNALSIIKKLKPTTYYLDSINPYGLNFSSKKQYGFIAQDVQRVLPDLVTAAHKPATIDSLGNQKTQAVDYVALNYTEFIPLLMRGIQEQSKTIDSLKTKTTNQDSINKSLQNQINALSDMINACCSSHRTTQNNNTSTPTIGNSISSMDVKLSDVQAIVLDQNVPNPFAEQTTINYFLTDDVNKAQMLFYNASGTLIKSVELTQRGQGQLNVFAQDLTNGMYTYTLVVDGNIFATKKMVKQ